MSDPPGLAPATATTSTHRDRLSPRALYQEVAERLRQQIFAARSNPAAGSTR